MHLRTCSVALGAAVALLSGSALGQQILLDQQPSQAFSLKAHIGVEATADDFVIADPAGADLIEFTCWGTWEASGALVSDTFDVLIHADDATPMFGNVPGAVIASFPGQAPTVTATGLSMPTASGLLPEYELVFVLPAAVSLAPGTYWIELYSTGSSATGEQFAWEMAPQDPVYGDPCVAWSLQTPGVTWNPCTPLPETDMALQIRGSSPDITALCFGDGSGATCPCGNAGGPAEGCANSSGAGAALTAAGVPSLTNDTLVLTATGVLPGQPGLFFQGDTAINGGLGAPFGDGLRCCGMNVIRLSTLAPDAGGCAASDASCGTDLSAPVPAGPISQHPQNALAAGDTRCYQFWYRDPLPSAPCGSTFNLTNAIELTWGM